MTMLAVVLAALVLAPALIALGCALSRGRGPAQDYDDDPWSMY